MENHALRFHSVIWAPRPKPIAKALRRCALALVLRGGLVAPVVATLWAGVCGAAPPENACGSNAIAVQQLRASGNLAAARARLAACLTAGCPGEVQDCARQLAEVDAAMPTVVVEARDEANEYVTDARVTMDGAPWLDRLEGKEIPVNPGEHRLTLEAPGFRKTENTLVAREGQKKLRVVFLVSARGAATKPEGAPPATAPTVRRGPDESSLSTGRKFGLALGGAGVGGLAVGAIFGILSKAMYDHALHSECGGDPNRCTADGIADGNTAHSEATIATLGFAAGSVLFAAGAALYFTSPEHASVAIAPAVQANGAGLTMVGKW